MSVQFTPTYAPLEIPDQVGNDAESEYTMTLGGMWNPEQIHHKGEVHFRWNKYRYEASYLDNEDAAKRIRQLLEEIGFEHIDSVVVTAYASPEGVYEHNQMLSRKRAREFERVVKSELGLAGGEVAVTVKPGGEAWALLRERIEQDESVSETARERILKLLDDPKVGWDTKKWRMEHGRLGKTRKEGDVYRWLLRNHYRYLRSLAVDIHVTNVVVAFDGAGVDVVPEEPTAAPVDTATVAQEAPIVEEVVLTDEVPEPGVVVSPAPEETAPEQAETAPEQVKETAPEQVKETAPEVVKAPAQEPLPKGDSILRETVVDHEYVLKLAESGEQGEAAEGEELPLWPIIGLSTNLIYDATYIPGYGFTSIPSVSLEYYPVGGHVTVGADVEWPSWKHADEHRYFQIHNITLWGRYYFKPEQYRFNGWYVGGSANTAQFGVGWNKKGWVGEGLGLSVLGGHKWTFGRIYIDMGLALGAFYSRFDSYTWGNDATKWYYYDYVGDPEAFMPRSKRWLWLGPTRLQVSIGVDLFNRNRKKNK